MEDQTWKTSLKQCGSKLRSSCLIASVLPALRSLLTDEEYSRVEDKEGNFGRVDELVAILLDKDETTFDEFCSLLEEKGYSQLCTMHKRRERIGNNIVEPLVQPQSENIAWKLSLQKHHKHIRAGILVARVLPALRPLLTKAEYSQIEDEVSNIRCIDELIQILLTKNESTFNTFCSILDTNGHTDWANKLQGTVTEPSIPLGSSFAGNTGKKSTTDKLPSPTGSCRLEIRSPPEQSDSAIEPLTSIGGRRDNPLNATGRESTASGPPIPTNRPVIRLVQPSEAKIDKVLSLDMIWSFLKDLFMKTQVNGEVFGVLLVGETGSGKSTLINNLVGKDVVKVGHTLASETSQITELEMDVEGVPVALYDTPGLSDSRGDNRDEANLTKLKVILKSGKIHLVIYCMKLSETRMRESLIHTFQEYHKIGVKWEQTVIALTFADSVPVPKDKRRSKNFEMGSFFVDRLAEMRAYLIRVFEERLGVTPEVASKIHCNPSTSDTDQPLENGEEWYTPFWMDVLELLTPGAAVQFLNMHKDNLEDAFQEEGVDDYNALLPPDDCTPASAVHFEAITATSMARLPDHSRIPDDLSGVSEPDTLGNSFTSQNPSEAVPPTRSPQDDTPVDKQSSDDHTGASAVHLEANLSTPTRPDRCSLADDPSGGREPNTPGISFTSQNPSEEVPPTRSPQDDTPVDKQSSDDHTGASAVHLEANLSTPTRPDRCRLADDPSGGREPNTPGISFTSQNPSEEVPPTPSPQDDTPVDKHSTKPENTTSDAQISTPNPSASSNNGAKSSPSGDAESSTNPTRRLHFNRQAVQRLGIIIFQKVRPSAVGEAITNVVGIVKSLFSRKKKT